MRNRSEAIDVTWPLVPGAVLLLSGGVVVYALRGPSLELPGSAVAALLILLAALALGQLSRLAASAFAWGIDAVWAIDLFQERRSATSPTSSGRTSFLPSSSSSSTTRSKRLSGSRSR